MAGLIKIVKEGTEPYKKEVARIEERGFRENAKVAATVHDIILQVRKRGDKALLQLTKKFDAVDLSQKGFSLSKGQMKKALNKVPASLIEDLRFSAERIRKFHEYQLEKSWSVKEEGGELGQIIRPLERVGIYAPGGKAAYSSSVLMNALPARVAGVEKVVLTTPATGGEINPAVLAAAHIAGVDEAYALGGAQAIAALAFGTESVPRVNKITGPGNIFVAEAKRQLYGVVGIDMVAGPSEILVLADEKAPASYIAADLISQAEHDEQAYPLLVTDSLKLALEVEGELEKQVALLERKRMTKQSLKRNCVAFVVKEMAKGVDLTNCFAPEHLEIMTEKPKSMLSQIKNAGAIFVGPYTPEALGDYTAGPNHVLPTGGAARFFSPLGVYDFLKKTSLLSFSRKGLERIGSAAMGIAEAEGLTGHAEAVRVRLSRRR